MRFHKDIVWILVSSMQRTKQLPAFHILDYSAHARLACQCFTCTGFQMTLLNVVPLKLVIADDASWEVNEAPVDIRFLVCSSCRAFFVQPQQFKLAFV